MFKINPWKSTGRAPVGQAISDLAHPVACENNAVNARILSLVVDLGNTVLTKRAASDLHA